MWPPAVIKLVFNEGQMQPRQPVTQQQQQIQPKDEDKKG
jgi:hypothetical protein